MLALNLGLIYLEYQQKLAETKEELLSLERSFKPMLDKALWTLETEAVKSVVSSVMQSPILVGVKIVALGQEHASLEAGVVLNDQGQTITNDEGAKTLSEIESLKNSTLIEHAFTIKHASLDNVAHELGKVYFYSSKNVVYEKLKASYWALGSNILIQILAFGLLLLWFSHKFITKPILRIVGLLHRDDENAYHNFKENPYMNDKSELSSISRAFKECMERIETMRKNNDKILSHLNYSERYMEDVFNSMSAMLMGLDKNGKVCHWNKTCEKYLNITEKEARDRSLLELVPAWKKYTSIVTDALRDKTIKRQEKIKLKITEKEHYFNLVVYPLGFSDGGVIIKVEDVTDKVRAQNTIIRNEKMNSVGILATGLAHELNNPLGAILQGVQNVHRRLDPALPKNKEVAEQCDVDLEKIFIYLQKRDIISFLTVIIVVGERATQIVKNVLKFNRQDEAVMRPINIHKVIDETVEFLGNDYELKKFMDFKKIEIVKNYDKNLTSLPCFGVEMEQAILHVLKNSAFALTKFSGDKVPKIVISTQVKEETALLIFNDNGPGMDANSKLHAFEPFFTTREVGQGMGLGLAISYFIVVEKHHGEIEIESDPGKGATIIFRLPLKQAETEDDAHG